MSIWFLWCKLHVHVPLWLCSIIWVRISNNTSAKLWNTAAQVVETSVTVNSNSAFSRNSMRLLFLSFLAGNIVFDVFLSLFFFFDCLFFLICQIKRVKDADEVPMVCKCFYVLAFCFISLGKFLWESYSTLLYFCCNKNSQWKNFIPTLYSV